MKCIKSIWQNCLEWKKIFIIDMYYYRSDLLLYRNNITILFTFITEPNVGPNGCSAENINKKIILHGNIDSNSSQLEEYIKQ